MTDSQLNETPHVDTATEGPFTIDGIDHPMATAAALCGALSDGRVTIDGRPLCPRTTRALQVIAASFAITYTPKSLADAQDAIDTVAAVDKLLKP